MRTQCFRSTIFKDFYSKKSVPQRFYSFRGGETVDNQTIIDISDYVGCDFYYLFSENIEFKPVENYDKKHLFGDALYKIFNILDMCATTEAFYRLQVQLSRVALFYIQKAGVTIDDIAAKAAISREKLDFLVSGNRAEPDTNCFGFNLSEIFSIADNIPEIPNIQYIFTGISEDFVTLLKQDKLLSKLILS